MNDSSKKKQIVTCFLIKWNWKRNSEELNYSFILLNTTDIGSSGQCWSGLT